MTHDLALLFAGLARSDFRSILIDSSVKGAVLLSLTAFGLACWRSSSGAIRHSVWCIALTGLLGMPILSLIVPGWTILPAWMNTQTAPTAIAMANTHDATRETLAPARMSKAEEFWIKPSYSSDTLITVPDFKLSGASDTARDAQSGSAANAPAAASDALQPDSAGPSESGGPETHHERRNFVFPWVVAIWSFGAVILILRLAVCQVCLSQLARRSCPVTGGRLREATVGMASSLGIRTPVRLFLAADRRIPMTWGLLSNRLVLPIDAAEWDEGRLRSVLMHELIHVVRWDSQTQLIAQVVRSLYWWNPLTWLAVARMDVERERACDDAVLAKGVPAAEYANHLVGVAFGLSPAQIETYGALAMARPSRLETRIVTLLDHRTNRRATTTMMRLALIIGLIVLVLPISTLRAVGRAANALEDPAADANIAKDVPNPPSQQPPNQPPKVEKAEATWSNSVDGLQFRLSTVRTEFEAWELPTFQLEVRNQGTAAVSKAQANALIGEFRKKEGLFFLFKDEHRRAPDNENRWVIPRVRFDADELVGLAPNQSIRQSITIESLREESSPEWGVYDLRPGRYTIGLGYVAVGPKTQLITNEVTMSVLPPGIRKSAFLAKWLKPKQIDDQVVDVGFVPNKTTTVLGEPIFVTMVIQNKSDTKFTFEFGGDYRGTGRHERFKIGVTDASGKSLIDPLEARGAFDGGGILMWRTAQAHDIAIETVDLATFREFPGPGEYMVSARFDLTRSWTTPDKSDFKVPVETSYKLTILPREPANVEPVLNEMFEQARQTGSGALTRVINTICSFGKEASVPGLGNMLATQDREHRIAAATGLGKIVTAESRDLLLKAIDDPELSVRVAVVAALSDFTDAKAIQAMIRGLSDKDESIRTTAAQSLGKNKTGDAIEALTARLSDSPPTVSAAILRAMGQTQSPKVFPILERSLSSDNDLIRNAALDGISNFGPGESAGVLRRFTSDDHMDFRELVIRTLAEKLRQPIDPSWLVPVIQSRRKANSIGDAPRLLRLHTGNEAAPTLLKCLDFDNPNIRGYYNLTIIDNQLACNGLAIPWIADLNRDGTPAEIEQNRKTLRQIKAWIDHYQSQPWVEPDKPWKLPSDKEEATWSEPAENLQIRAHTNRSVWPEGLPQVITLEARDATKGGSVIFQEPLALCEVEVNGEWYARASNADTKVSGDWNAYHGHQFHDLQLDHRWQRISDKAKLELKPGRYKARIRLSLNATDDKSNLATTQPVEFEVLRTSP